MLAVGTGEWRSPESSPALEAGERWFKSSFPDSVRRWFAGEWRSLESSPASEAGERWLKSSFPDSEHCKGFVFLRGAPLDPSSRRSHGADRRICSASARPRLHVYGGGAGRAGPREATLKHGTVDPSVGATGFGTVCNRRRLPQEINRGAWLVHRKRGSFTGSVARPPKAWLVHRKRGSSTGAWFSQRRRAFIERKRASSTRDAGSRIHTPQPRGSRQPAAHTTTGGERTEG